MALNLRGHGSGDDFVQAFQRLAHAVRRAARMGVYRFEDLRVWQAAKRQCDRVGELIKRHEFLKDPGLSSQMNNASISVMSNISEGFLRRRDREFLQHLRYSAASNGEVRSDFYAALGRRYIGEAEANDLIEENNSIGKMIRRLQQSLERSLQSGRGIKDG